MDTPTVSVIVPVLDGLDGLVRCVRALLDQDYPADRVEILVADNGSAVDPAPHLPADERVTVIHEPRPGSYAARNAALGVAKGEVLAFTDADCLPDRGWLTAAVAALQQEPRADMIGGAVELTFDGPGGRPRNGAEWHEYLHSFKQESYLAEQGFAVTANLVTWRDVVERVGEFDAALKSGGDAEWSRRVTASGGTQRYAPQAVVRHPARASWGEVRDKNRRVTAGVRERLARQGNDRVKLARLLAGQVTKAVRTSATAMVATQPDTLRGKLGYSYIGWRLCFSTCRTLAPAFFSRRG
jgi:GT2 family glycosyltransferase